MPFDTVGEHFEHPDKGKLLYYLFLCLVYELKNDNAEAILQEPVWSDPETTFSILLNYAGAVSHDYCCSCIEALDGKWRRECGTTTTAYMNSKVERDEVKNRFLALLDNAQRRLAGFYDRSPQEHYFLKTNPVLLGIDETPNNHFLFLRADIADGLDSSICNDLLGDCEFDESDGKATTIKVSCYRKKWRSQLVRYLKNLGVREAI